jgi:hypothetical protein
MSGSIINTLGGIFFTVLGLGFAIFYKFVGSKAAYSQQKFWSLFHFRIEFTETDIKRFQIGFLIIGLAFIVFGLLTIFQAIRFR